MSFSPHQPLTHLHSAVFRPAPSQLFLSPAVVPFWLEDPFIPSSTHITPKAHFCPQQRTVFFSFWTSIACFLQCNIFKVFLHFLRKFHNFIFLCSCVKFSFVPMPLYSVSSLSVHSLMDILVWFHCKESINQYACVRLFVEGRRTFWVFAQEWYIW